MSPSNSSSLVHLLWHLHRPERPALALRLLPDGRLLGASPRAAWSLDGDAIALAGLGDIERDPDLHLRRRGAAQPLPVFTASMPDGEVALRPDLDDLHVEIAMRGWDRPLLIVFSSHGSPYSDGDTRWQFFHLLLDEPFNYARVSERIDPHFWYLNKTSRLVGLLDPLLDHADSPVVICGTSSGGYASLAFGERLARLHPTRPIRTVTINPQIVLGPLHNRHLRQHVEERFLPVLIDDDAWAQRDTAIVDVHEIVAAGRRGDVWHIIHHDALNPAEAYHL